MGWVIRVVIALPFVVGTVALAGFESRDAQKALSRYQKALEKIENGSGAKLIKARQAFHSEVRKARELYLSALREARIKCVKDEDWAEVKRIDEALAKVRALPDPIPGPEKQIHKDAKEFGGHHYFRFPECLTWNLARRKCEELGGHLVRIESKEEHEFVVGLVRSGAHRQYWIDGSDEREESVWRLSNGAPMPIQDWSDTEGNPGQDNLNDAEHWVCITRQTGRMYDVMAGVRYSGYICEWD